MKRVFILILFLIGLSYGQSPEAEVDSKKTYIIKFSPVLWAPSVGFERVVNEKWSYGLDLKLKPFPLSSRLEFSYRRYFHNTAPHGAFLNLHVAAGYSDWEVINFWETRSILLGGGVAFGTEKYLKKDWVVEIYGGVQVIAPIYIKSASGNYSLGRSYRSASNIYNYITTAPILQIGVKFGKIKYCNRKGKE